MKSKTSSFLEKTKVKWKGSELYQRTTFCYKAEVGGKVFPNKTEPTVPKACAQVLDASSNNSPSVETGPLKMLHLQNYEHISYLIYTC